jgi:hypothetical protein
VRCASPTHTHPHTVERLTMPEMTWAFLAASSLCRAMMALIFPSCSSLAAACAAIHATISPSPRFSSARTLLSLSFSAANSLSLRVLSSRRVSACAAASASMACVCATMRRPASSVSRISAMRRWMMVLSCSLRSRAKARALARACSSFCVSSSVARARSSRIRAVQASSCRRRSPASCALISACCFITSMS